MEEERRCWAEVDLDALRHNFRLARAWAAGAAVMAVVKADAYGHGGAAVAALLERAGADAFAVACRSEAMSLRRAGVAKPILILGWTGAESAAALAAHDIGQAVFSLEYARALSDAAVRAGTAVRVHIKLDTGMGRLGFPAAADPDAAVRQIAAACALPGLRAEGIFTHFAAADGGTPEDAAYTRGQYAAFRDVAGRLAARGFPFRFRHCCNSAGTFAWPEFHENLVRPGILLYGEPPSDAVSPPGLRPALRLCAAVAQVKTLRTGDAVSYGRTFRAGRPVRAATLAVGYADGYPRAMSNRGTVSLHGRPARVLGRVCMDQLVVDVTDIPEAAPGDTAVVFGGGAADSTADVARMAGAIPYEVLCGVGRRVPRVYVGTGAQAALPDDWKGE